MWVVVMAGVLLLIVQKSINVRESVIPRYHVLNAQLVSNRPVREEIVGSTTAQQPGSVWRLPPMLPHRIRPSTSQGALPEASGMREIDTASGALPVEATLRQRLDVWKNAPGGRGEVPGEVELGGFMQWNLEVSDLGSKQDRADLISNAVQLRSRKTHI